MSIEGFDSEISGDLISKYDEQSSLGADILGGTVATVADFAASTWNSLTPKSMETSTEDLLVNIDSNALRVYNENPDTIHAASFIGGMFIPTGLALKGMNAARSGMKGVNFFSEAGQIAQRTRVAEAFANAGIASSTYKNSLYSMYMAGAGNMLIDTVAAEAAMVIAMNAHPMMEDYMKDLPKNFLTSVAIGGVIGGGIGHIIDRSAVKGIKMGVEREASDLAYSGYESISTLENISGNMAARARNVEAWDNILASAKELPAGEMGPVRTLNNFTKNMVETLAARERTAIVTDFERMASPEMKLLPEAQRSNLINMITENPERFAGIDSIRFVNAKEDLPNLITPPKSLVESTFNKPVKIGTQEVTLDIPMVEKTKAGLDKSTTMIYSPKFDAFMLQRDLKHYGTAADLIQDPAKLTEGLQNNWHLVPRYDQTLEASRMTTSAVDADFLKSLKYYDELPIDAFTKSMVAISPDDTSVLSAVYARISKEVEKNPEFLSSLRVKLTKELPNYDLTGTQVIEKIITNTVTKTVSGGSAPIKGLSKNVLDDFTKYLRSDEGLVNDLMSPKNSLSEGSRSLAQSFSTDQMWPLHNGLEMARRKNHIPQKTLSEEQALKWGSDSYKELRNKGLDHTQAMERVGHEDSNLGKFAEELYNSKETKAIRAKLAKSADSEGYIYLYRGMRGKAAGHSPGESYTPDYKIALSFANGNPSNVGLYRVHPDEVVGYLGSFGSKKGGEAELVLDVPTRTVAGKPQVITGDQASGHSVTEVLTGQDIQTVIKKTASKEENLVGLDGIFEQLVKTKQNDIMSMLEQGVPPQTISLHTNVPLDTIEAFMTSSSKDLLELSKPISSYSSAAEVPMYLGVENRALAINTNMNKVPTTRIKNTLQQNILTTTDRDVKMAMLLGSKSEISREIGTYLQSDTVQAQMKALEDEVGRVTDSAVGTKMFASSDFALRDLGVVGAVATAIGKDVNELINKRVAKLWEPMKGHMTAISKDAAATVELNTAMKVNASIKGYREVRNGTFYVQDANNMWKEIKDAVGKVIGKERNMIPVEYKGKVFQAQTPSVVSTLKEMQVAGRELFEMRNSINTISGRPLVNDLGFWAPPFNPRNKNITYVWDKVENKTTLLHGKTPEELITAENAFKSSLPPGDLGRRYELIQKGEQADFNKIQGRHDTIFMDSADATSFHSGSSASEIVSTNADVLVDLANGYDHWIGYGVRSMLDMQMSNVMSRMDDLSHISQISYKDQPLGKIQKFLQKPKDPGMIMRNTLLGNSNLDQSVFWEKLSEVTGGVAEFGLTTINNALEPILNTGKGFFGKGKGASDKAYIDLMENLKARGIDNPFMNMDDHLAKEMFHVQQISQAPNMTPRILALSNSLAATVMLRFMELSQPYVNAISLPILTSAAMGRKLEASFMGGVLNPKAKFGVIETMYNGIRYGGSLEGKALVKEAESSGLFKALVSEATEVQSQARNLSPGLITSMEKGLAKLNSDAVEKNLFDTLLKLTTKPADWSETMVRKQAFLTGAYMAKEAYPGISKAGIMTFARDFMDQAIGNYSSAQRPIMFQGTLGVAMGLFQTYMLTTAQDIYRLVENKNWKSLGKMMLAQSTIFGARSLPGFNYVSEMIGEHFSDQNFDLTTGLYKAVPSGLADVVLYGLPSNLGPAITTRGEIQPRIPNVLGEGLNAIPSFNILKQAYDSADRVTSAMFTADKSTGKAMLEALSLQSISRPIARMSELLSGHSITGKGNLIAGPEEVWTVRSAIARAMATRPLEEIKAREAIHLNTLYGSIDRDKRQEVTQTLRTHIRDNNLTSELVDSLGERYMRTGSSSGWKSAVNNAIAQTETPSTNTVRNYLRPNTPFQLMIDDVE